MVFKIVESLEKRLLNAFQTSEDVGYSDIAVLSGVTVGGTSYLLAATDSVEKIPAGLVFLTVLIRSADKIKDANSVIGKSHSVMHVLSLNETKDGLLLFPVAEDDSAGGQEIVVLSDNAFLSSVVELHVIGSFSRNADTSNVSFQLKNSKFILKKTEKGSVQDIYGHVVDQESQDLDDTPGPADMKKKLKDKLKKKRITEKAPLYFEVSPSQDLKDLSLKDKLVVEVTVFSSLTDKITVLWTTLKDAIDQQLSLLKNSTDGELLSFFPRGITCHEISVVYPLGKSDDELVETRRRIHLENFLALDRPVVRRLNKIDTSSSIQLINPHEGLENPKFPVIAVVQGRYAYHHYLQDNFSDNGWGCAYRSLQTIVSWFRLQGFIDKPIPSHKDIQQALVDCGDKPSSFVGSTKWIGSNEVSFVLNQLYGITSKMMFVSAGSEMVSKGRELVSHFKNQGTPVMIGGGVLAHTIIGVAFDEKKGDTMFLILDPHYTGSEDLSTVQKKGWCSWKPASFWEKNSFYNMCLPQPTPCI